MGTVVEELRRRIEVRGQLSLIAKAAGLDHGHVLRIARGERKNPGYKTIKKLERALAEVPEPTAGDVHGEAVA